jgi:DNA-binding transcriptional regulator YdaS (Cro superfamily)
VVSLKISIERASRVVGSQRALAQLLGETEQHISSMKQGSRPCSIEKRVKIAEIAGTDTTRAVIEGLIEKLDLDDETQAGAAVMLQSMLDAFPETD